MPKVSVIIPCYNSERFLTECLDSVLAQTLKDIEVICVDDGSTDRTLEMLRQYEKNDKRLRVLTQENQYAGVARNTGMAAATGKYYIFLDSDDFFEPIMLEKMYKKCEEDDADICVCGGGTYDMSQKKLMLSHYRIKLELLPENTPFSAHDMPGHVFSFCNTGPCNKLIRADLIKEYSLEYQALQQVNDAYFVCCALIMAKKITIVDQWFLYIRRGTSTSLVERSEKRIYCLYEMVQTLKNFLEKHEIFDEFKESFIAIALGGASFSLSLAKTKEQWLDTANFLKSKYMNEFGLWEYLKKSKGDDGYKFISHKLMALIMESSAEKLNKYEPVLRKDEHSIGEAAPFTFNDNPLKVSVIIPVYNMTKYVEETVRSVMRQSLKDIEIICVDDGSTDDSLDIIKKLAKEDSRIIIVEQENRGLGGARNTGFKVSKGEYVSFIDSDDTYAFCAIENMYRHAKLHSLDHLFCEADSFYDPADYYQIHPDFRNQYKYKKIPCEIMPGKELALKLIRDAEYYASAALQMARREFLEENNIFFTEGVLHEDETYTMRLLIYSQRTGVLKEPLFFRRIRAESIMTTEKGWKNIFALYVIIAEYETMILNEEPGDFRYILGRQVLKFTNTMLRTYRSISKDWSLFPEDVRLSPNFPVAGAISLFIKSGTNKNIEAVERIAARNGPISRFAQCCLDHGFIYTIKLAFAKVLRRGRK